MIEVGRKTNQELATTDIFALSDDGLKEYIGALQEERNNLKFSVVPSVGECNALIALAHAERAARSTDRTTKVALWLSVVAIVVTCVVATIEILID